MNSTKNAGQEIVLRKWQPISDARVDVGFSSYNLLMRTYCLIKPEVAPLTRLCKFSQLRNGVAENWRNLVARFACALEGIAAAAAAP